MSHYYLIKAVQQFGGFNVILLRGRDLWNIYQVSQKLVQAFKSCWRGIHIQRHRQQGDPKSLLLFFQNKESRPK
jgi:hypothetical protein